MPRVASVQVVRSSTSHVPPRARWTRVAGAVLLAAGVLTMPSCSKLAPGAGQREGGRSAAVPVKVATATHADVPLQLSAIGRVEPYQTVTIKPQVAGQISRVDFTEGQEVQAGTLLISIDPRSYEAALRQAEANLARDTALTHDAEVEAKWQADLVKQNAAAAREYEKAQAAADALRATVRADEAAVQKARLDVEYCSIRAPFAGRTGSRLADLGSVVKINETPLVTINQIAPVYVTFSLPEQHVPAIRKYQAAGTLVVEAAISGAEKGAPERGTLTFLDNQVDATTGMIELKGTFGNEQQHLWPRQFVNVVLTLTTEAGAVVVPSEAVQTGQSGQYVFVVGQDRKVTMRPVAVARAWGEQSVIRRGVEAGEVVVTEGQLRLVAGAEVTFQGQPTSQQGPPS